MIFSYVAETPFVAVEYADKVTSLLDHYGYKHRGISLSTVTSRQIINILDDIHD